MTTIKNHEYPTKIYQQFSTNILQFLGYYLGFYDMKRCANLLNGSSNKQCIAIAANTDNGVLITNITI